MGALFSLTAVAASARAEPEGVLLYHQPLTSYTEAFEYQSFRQDNALYSTVVTTRNERKQLKSGGVLALVPYPPAGFEPLFDETAGTALRKIAALEANYPQVKPQLEIARRKWARARAAFQQTQKMSSTPAARRTEPSRATLARDARLTSATAEFRHHRSRQRREHHSAARSQHGTEIGAQCDFAKRPVALGNPGQRRSCTSW